MSFRARTKGEGVGIRESHCVPSSIINGQDEAIPLRFFIPHSVWRIQKVHYGEIASALYESLAMTGEESRSSHWQKEKNRGRFPTAIKTLSLVSGCHTPWLKSALELHLNEIYQK